MARDTRIPGIRRWFRRRRCVAVVHRRIVPAAILLIVALVAFGRTLSPFAAMSHESFDNYARAHQFMQEVRWGHFHPALLRDGFDGMASGFLLFYPPLGTYASALGAWLADDLVLGVNIALFASVLVSGLGLHALGTAARADRWIVLLASAAYMTAPYRFVNIHVRGAMAESWSLAICPWLLLGIWRTVRHARLDWLLPVATALMFLAHSVMALWSGLACAAFVIAGCIAQGWRSAIRPAIGAVLGVAMAAWFLLPQQRHLSSIHLSDPAFMGTSLAGVLESRVTFEQLFFSDERLWIGASGGPHLDEMSHELGAGVWGCLVLALGLSGMARARRCRTGGAEFLRRAFGWAALASFVCCVLVMLAPGVLRFLPEPFMLIQFPWRLLGPATLLGVLVLPLFARSGNARSGGRALALLGVVVLSASVPDYQKRPSVHRELESSAFTRESIRADHGKRGFCVFGEYLPKEFPLPAARIPYLLDLRAPQPLAVQASTKLEFAETGDGSWRLRCETESGDAVAVPLVHYPVWRATLSDGTALKTGIHQGLLAIEVPPGTNSVRIDYGPDRWTKIGCCISAAALVAMVGVVLLERRCRRSARPA